MEPTKEETQESEKERMKSEDIDSEEDKKKKKKGKTESGENPSEAGDDGADANSSISPNMSTPSAGQHVMAGNSGIAAPRSASAGSSSGQSPSEVSYGKSATPDLQKSPVFVELSKQLEAMQGAVEKKFEAISKSFNDRIDNMLKELENTEKSIKDFYSGSFYKAAGENVTPEATVRKSISEQVEDGKIRFSY